MVCKELLHTCLMNPPAFLGDPHYGATLHFMEERLAQGPQPSIPDLPCLRSVFSPLSVYRSSSRCARICLIAGLCGGTAGPPSSIREEAGDPPAGKGSGSRRPEAGKTQRKETPGATRAVFSPCQAECPFLGNSRSLGTKCVCFHTYWFFGFDEGQAYFK